MKNMSKHRIMRGTNIVLFNLFVGASAWAQEEGTVNYFVSPQAWFGTDSDNTVMADSDYTKVVSNGNKIYVNIAMPDSMATGEQSNYKVSDINSFSITTRQSEGANPVQNAYFNIYTQKAEGSASTNWYESRLNSEPYYATDYDKYAGAGQWYTWSTENNGDNAYLTIYDSSPNAGANGAGGFQGAYGVGATMDELKGGAVSITNPSDPSFSKDYSQEKLSYIAINVNDTKNNMSNPGLDIKSFNMNLAGQDYAWNFIGEGSTWNVSGKQIAADKISNMKVNVSGSGTVLTTRNGLFNSVMKLTDSAVANIDGAEYVDMVKTASWANLEYSVEPLVEVAAGTSLSMSNSKFTGNSFTHEGALASGTWGKGAIYVNGSISMTDSVMDGNTFTVIPGNRDEWVNTSSGVSVPNLQGSVIHFSGADAVGDFDNVKFSNNSASSANVQGGAIVAWGGTYSFKNSSFENNSALALNDSEYTISGGALYVTDSWSNGTISVDISGTNFSGNKVEGNVVNGGAVLYESYQEGSHLTVSDSSFSGNKAIGKTRAEGGALRLFTTSTSEKTVFNNVSFTDNAVEVESPADMSRNGGGAIYANATDVQFNVTGNATYSGNYVAVGGQKNDKFGGFIRLSSYQNVASSASFNVSENATLTIGDGREGFDSIASTDNTAIVSKEGLGNLTVNSSMEYFTGALNVVEGVMNVNNVLGASSVSIASGATLGVTVGSQNAFSNAALTSDTYSNQGTLVVSAKSGLASGAYALSAGTINDFGNVVVYGGSLSGNTFTLSDINVVSLDSFDSPIDVLDNGRVALVASSGSDSLVEMSFNSEAATINGVDVVSDDLVDSLGTEVLAAEAYSFDVNMNEEDTVLLSFLVGDSTLSLEDFVVYHRENGQDWEVASDISSLAYDGEYLSFIVSGFSDYGYIVIPEPSTYALLFGVASLVAVWRRRRK